MGKHMLNDQQLSKDTWQREIKYFAYENVHI